MGASVDYLLEDRSTGRLSFRRTFPPELRPHVPGNLREWKRSLGARKIDEPGALEKYKDASVEYDRLATLARKAASNSFDPLTSVSIALLKETFRVRLLEEDERKFLSGEDSRRIEERRENVEINLSEFRDHYAERDLNLDTRMWGEESSALALSCGMLLNRNDPLFAQLCRAVLEAKIAALEDIEARLRGQVVPTPPEPLQVSMTAERSSPQARTAKETFSAIAKRLMDTPRLAITANTKEATNTALRYFKETHGDLSPSEINRRKVADWLDLLAQRPSKLSRTEGLRPLPELVEKYAGDEAKPRLSPKTLNVLLRALGAMWNKGINDGSINEGLANPFTGHALPTPRRRGPPQQLSLEEMKAIFALPVFTEGERPTRGKGEAAYWLPLILLWTGCRPEEAAQLLVSDFFDNAEGRLMMRFSGEGDHPIKGAQRLKTDRYQSGERTIPISKKLVELGLREYLKHLSDAGETALFPLLRTKGKRRNLFPSWGEWWSLYTREHRAIPVGEGRRPAREFRHNWNSEARRAGMSVEASEYIQGHVTSSRQSANRGYGDWSPLGFEIDRIEFPGLDLSGVKLWDSEAKD
jgi:integrase